MSDEDEERDFEKLGVAQVRDFASGLVGAKRDRAYAWLEMKNQEERLLSNSLQTEQASAASRAATAAERAASAAEAQARTARLALTTARIANAIAIAALIVGVTAFLRSH